jgi:hypothetical protein
MKKSLLVCFALLGYLATYAQQDTSFTQVWARYGATKPSWFSDTANTEASFVGCERGIVYNPVTGHVLVASRALGIPNVYIVNALTGADLGELVNMGMLPGEEMEGGGYPLNNVTMSDDGQIFACNMTLASGPPLIMGEKSYLKAFRVYRWEYEEGLPEKVIDYAEGGYRLGDKFSVVGDYTSDAYIYAGPGESSKILRWRVQGGILNPVPETINLQDVLSAGTSITVAPIPGSDRFYVSGKGFLPTIFKADGTNLTQIKITANVSRIAGRIAEFNGRLYMCMFEGSQNGVVIDITAGGENVADSNIILTTPKLGNNFVYGEGAVGFAEINDSMFLYVCAPSNGIACYKLNALGKRNTGIHYNNDMAKTWNVTSFPNPATDFIQVGFQLPAGVKGNLSLDLFSINGQQVKVMDRAAVPGAQKLELDVRDLPSGTYFIRMKNESNVAVQKVVIQ